MCIILHGRPYFHKWCDCCPSPAGSQEAPTLFPHCECGLGKNPKEAKARVRWCTLLWMKSLKIHRNMASCWAAVISTNNLYQYACYYIRKFLFCLRVCSRHQGPHCFQLNSHGRCNFSSLQMAKLRSLSKNGENEPVNPLVDNCRPIQPVKGRIVRASFKWSLKSHSAEPEWENPCIPKCS